MEKVLVIDDDQAQVKTLSGILRKEGYEALTAYNSEVGLIKARELKPDIILLDIGMPGMSGYEICSRLKSAEETKDILIIMVTGKGTGEAFEKAMETKADWYIVKPYSFEHLFKVLDKAKKYKDK